MRDIHLICNAHLDPVWQWEWQEEYEPSLFVRIQSLVREGRWHIMGGWYLQPDCNIPGGESIWRQILAGRR